MIFVAKIDPPRSIFANSSYGSFGYYKLGLGCWVYNPALLEVSFPQFGLDVNIGQLGLYEGAVEWINTLTFLTEPKYANPLFFKFWFQPGVVYTAQVLPSQKITVPDMFFGPSPLNLVTGKGMPLVPVVE